MLTIHMTTYRRHASGLLRKAVESVLSQDYADFEFIICDDASVDGSMAYLNDVAAMDCRVRVLRNPTNVNSVAISLGRCLLASDPVRHWLSWMFDDCILLPGALSHLVAAVEASPSMRMVYGVTEVLQRNGSILRVGVANEAEIKARIAASSLLVPNGGLLVHRSVFDRVGWYDASVVLRRSCDWDLFRRIVDGGIQFGILPDVLMREYGDLQPDSLRNSFTTTFDMMARFVQARDAAGARLDVKNVMIRPVDWIPQWFWTEHELNLMRYMFAEYFLSVADVGRAFHWARLLAEDLGGARQLMLENLLQRTVASDPPGRSDLAIGAFTGVVVEAWREQRQNR